MDRTLVASTDDLVNGVARRIWSDGTVETLAARSEN
jgi:hypothetical protein